MKWDGPLWLQLMGRWVDGGTIQPMQAICEPIYLPAGSIGMENDALGVINREPVPLDHKLMVSPWVLYAYSFSASKPDGAMGDEHILLRLSYGMMVDRPLLACIPPGAIQPEAPTQPLFTVNPATLQRNPCPGYRERVFVYRTPDQPFQASAVIYVDGAGVIASVELFNQQLHQRNRDVIKRCWVSLYR